MAAMRSYGDTPFLGHEAFAGDCTRWPGYLPAECARCYFGGVLEWANRLFTGEPGTPHLVDPCGDCGHDAMFHWVTPTAAAVCSRCPRDSTAVHIWMPRRSIYGRAAD